MPMSVETYVALGLDQWGPNEINGRSNAEIMKSLNVDGDAAYHPCAEAYPVEGNEQGTVTKFADWQQTQVYEGSIRDMWVYRPPGMQNLSSVIVFNDGGEYYNPQGAVRATHVLDNMLAAGEIEPTVAVFINPGSPRVYASQRSYEYDSMTPDYGRFLIDDVLPFVEKRIGNHIYGRSTTTNGMWYQQWRHLCLQHCLASSGQLCTGPEPLRIFHQHTRWSQLPLFGSYNAA